MPRGNWRFSDISVRMRNKILDKTTKSLLIRHLGIILSITPSSLFILSKSIWSNPHSQKTNEKFYSTPLHSPLITQILYGVRPFHLMYENWFGRKEGNEDEEIWALAFISLVYYEILYLFGLCPNSTWKAWSIFLFLFLLLVGHPYIPYLSIYIGLYYSLE